MWSKWRDKFNKWYDGTQSLALESEEQQPIVIGMFFFANYYMGEWAIYRCSELFRTRYRHHPLVRCNHRENAKAVVDYFDRRLQIGLQNKKLRQQEEREAGAFIPK